MARFAILLGGDVKPTERLKRQLAGARVIAADSGMAHAATLGLSPELWVGDFDSAGTDLADAYDHVPRMVYPAAKAATDGEIAIDAARERGATEIILVGAFGGQFDHAMAHGMAMIALAKEGLNVFCTSGSEEAYPLLGHLHFPALLKDTRFSIIGISPEMTVTIEGAHWPLDKRHVKLGSSLTLSNSSAGDLRVSLEDGMALMMIYPQEGQA